MTSPYPRNVEHGTLDEELHDISELRNAIGRLQSSPNITLPDCTEAFENGLQEKRGALKKQREHNVQKDALLNALAELDDSDTNGYDTLAKQALETIGDNQFGEQALIDAFNTKLDYEHRFEDEDEALRTIQALAEDIADGHY